MNTEAVTFNDFRGLEPPWISVNDFLPIEQREEYFRMYNDEPEFIVMIEGGVVPTVLCFNGEGWYAQDDDSFSYDVTHWLPLPNPPRRGRV